MSNECICFRCFRDTVAAFGPKEAYQVASYQCKNIEAHQAHHEQISSAISQITDAGIVRDFIRLSDGGGPLDFSSSNK